VTAADTITAAVLSCAGCVFVTMSLRRHNWGHAGLPLLLAGNLLVRLWPGVTVVAALSLADVLTHWRRRKRKRAAKAVGAKSRARIAGLVGTMRERVRRRPVLRPAPGGAS
jgi:hypothetical protein